MKNLKLKTKNLDQFTKFDQINGIHPLQKSCPNSYISYKARKRHGGKVAFFNFDLAKRMGLIPLSHEHKMTKELEKKILDTFSIVIINEYDIINKIQFPKEDILPNEFMATRYLQLQHPNKQGKTSGDGRSIWNGSITHQGKSWDVTSCGTGATRLSPATHIKNKFFQTGDPSISYGCGYSEIDEGLGTLFFSEILSRNGYETERVLGIIEFSKGISINIRAHENLIRPSHMFNHLKQGNYQDLKNIVNYYIDREIRNGRYKDFLKNDFQNDAKGEKEKFNYFLEKQTEIFARLAANFEDDYIFCWLDWDGDNILMDGGIIDYGSVRQFGLFHHEYRYDDVQRFSTTIKEQKDKAKYIVQNFIQIVDFLITKNKTSLNEFKNHKKLNDFEKIFEEQKNINILKKIGFEEDQIKYLLKSKLNDVTEFRKIFSYFERAKSQVGKVKVEDGINWNAIFCMRDILRELPQLLLHRNEFISPLEFVEIIRSSYATDQDMEPNEARNSKIMEYQYQYLKLIDSVAKSYKLSRQDILLKITMRSSVINKYDRITGDSITVIVDKVLKAKPKLDSNQVFELMREFSEYQNLDPDTKRTTKNTSLEQTRLMKGMLKVVRSYREGL